MFVLTSGTRQPEVTVIRKGQEYACGFSKIKADASSTQSNAVGYKMREKKRRAAVKEKNHQETENRSKMNSF